MEAINKIRNFILSNKLIKETLWSFIAKGVAFVFFYIFIIFLARSLGVELFGKWSFFYSILTIIFVISYFGVNPSAKIFLARSKDKNEISYNIFSSLKLRLIISFFFIIICGIVFTLIPASIIGDLRYLFILALPFIFLKALVEYLRHVFQGLHRIKYQSYINLCEYGLNLLLTVILVYFMFSLKSVVLALTISTLITVIFGFIFLKKFWNFARNKTKEKENIKKIFHYSLPLAFISFGFLIITEVDIVMLGWLGTPQEVGVYAAAKNFVNKLPQIAFAITMGVMPTFAKLNSENFDILKSRFKKVLKINFFIYVYISGAILLFSPFFVPLIFGAEYSNSVLPLQILSIWLFIVSFNVLFNSFLDFQKKAWRRAIHFSLTMALNIILNIIFIPILGPVGAAIATTLGYMVFVGLNGIEVRKSFSSEVIVY